MRTEARRRERLSPRTRAGAVAAAIVVAFMLWKILMGSAVPPHNASSAGAAPHSGEASHSYEAQRLPAWLEALAPGMTPEEYAAAIGKQGVTGSSPAEIRTYVWDTRDVAVKAAFREGRALFVEMSLTSGSRPPVQAKALPELRTGMTEGEVQAACGNPGLLRSRRLVAVDSGTDRQEVREWKVFDGELDAGATLAVTLHNGHVSTVKHPWSDTRRR